MKIKRYVDSDMRHVLRRVRQDQGPEAVILSNRRVDDGIEVVAAVDYDEALMQRALGQPIREPQLPASADVNVQIADSVTSNDAPSAERELAGSVPTASVLHDDNVGLQPDPEQSSTSLLGVREELSSLRELVEAQLAGLLWNDGTRRAPVRAQMLRNLARIGIAPDVANTVVGRLEPTEEVEQVWRAPLTEVAELIPTIDDRVLTEGGTVALIGPSGVGKTTTIAKIAARFSMHHGSDEIALICADAYRIGAKEHLTAFGNIIGVKVHGASTSDELDDLLGRLNSRKLVLIDTEGMSQRDHELANRLAAYTGSEDRVKFYLTLSAACQEAVIDETIREFSVAPLAGAIITKIDETAQLGCSLSAVIRHRLPVVWLSNGQRIPDDLHAAAERKLWLINQAIETMEVSDPLVDERLLAERYGQPSTAHA